MQIFIWVSILFSIFACKFHLAAGQGDFWGEYCGVSGNYTPNSIYQVDLDNVLDSLTKTSNGYGFYSSTSGKASAAALCRGDTSPDKCKGCVSDATHRLRQVCDNQVEATGLYDSCFLRYSNRSNGIGSLTSSSSNRNNISDGNFVMWNQTVVDMLGRLRPEAASGGIHRKYASAIITTPGLWTIFGIMQCTPDLSATECDRCLVVATTEIRRYDRSLGARVYKPNCVIRYQIYSFFGPTWYPSDKHVGLIIGPILGGVVVVAIAVFCIMWRCQKRKQKGPLLPEFQVQFSEGSPQGIRHEREDDGSGEKDHFNLSVIQVATNNFSYENKLGEGGFGPVYKGKLPDGKEIAVKRLAISSGQGLAEFMTEVELIIKLQHKNLVRLLGYCVEGTERLLIYEFMANNNLETFLFDPNKCKELDWAKRANIVIGISKGLRYLHEDSRLKIIHRDMKASNILLDEHMNARISDFGTARIFGGSQIEANTNRIVGTYGYMAPEYAMEGLFSTKSDVYSFGVLLLEIISGQRNNRFSSFNQPQNFLTKVWRSWKENKGEQLIDARLSQNFPVEEALRWINIALLCIQRDPEARPTMSTIVFMLEGQWSPNLPTPLEPLLSIARSVSISRETTVARSVSISRQTTISAYTTGPMSFDLTSSSMDSP